MSEFRFKQFSVRQDRAALKVGTDAVLLGALMTLPQRIESGPGTIGPGASGPGQALRLLDVGTGTGVIALMAAQRLGGRGFAITGIDIDAPSVADASENFAASPWASNLVARHCSLDEFSKSEDGQYDLIFSNPPYYDNSLTNPDARETAARHTGALSYRDILSFAAKRLTRPQGPEICGILSLILPAEEETMLIRAAASFDLFPFRIVRIRTSLKKKPKRIIAEFRLRSSSGKPELSIEELCLGSAARTGSAGRPSDPLAILKEDFYL